MTETPVDGQLDHWVNEGGASGPRQHARSLNILIIEDDAMIAMLYSELLSQNGHHVCGIASTENDAVAMAERLLPELIIADLGLREGSGTMAIRRITRDRIVPHLFVTGSAIHPGKTRDPAGMLRKPFNEDQLLAAIALAITGALSQENQLAADRAGG
ncbi:MAG: response regulator [Beijerinckiaceae bacterium]|nr:response regulator [Beijerinckiaceae bacterium]MCZ8300365.1 response regulator [Beijerinckiaceae bacterium]